MHKCLQFWCVRCSGTLGGQNCAERAAQKKSGQTEIAAGGTAEGGEVGAGVEGEAEVAGEGPDVRAAGAADAEGGGGTGAVGGR